MTLLRAALVVAAFATLASLVMGLTQLEPFLSLPASDRAAWVGALGTILAVVVAAAVAIGAGIHSQNLAREERAADRASASAEAATSLEADRMAAVALIYVAAERILSIRQSIREGGMTARIAVGAGVGALTVAQRSVSAFPLWLIRDQHCIIQFSHVPGLLDMAIQGVGMLDKVVGDDNVEVHAQDAAAVVQNLGAWGGIAEEKARELTARLGLPGYEPPGNPAPP